MSDFIKKQQELAKKEARWFFSLVELKDIENSLDILTAQIIQNTGAELLRLAEGEKVETKTLYYDDFLTNAHNKAIYTLKKHITSVTGVE